MSPHDRWVEELDRLEAAATVDEGPDPRRVHVDWVPPEDMPPLPVALLERAQAVLERQAMTREALVARAEQTRREHRAAMAARRGIRPSAAAPAAYLDVTA